MASEQAQALIETTVLCRMLLETLERTNDHSIASDELLSELHDLCERARMHLASLPSPG